METVRVPVGSPRGVGDGRCGSAVPQRAASEGWPPVPTPVGRARCTSPRGRAGAVGLAPVVSQPPRPPAFQGGETEAQGAQDSDGVVG